MTCDCIHNHSLTDNKFGCGSEWLLSVEYEKASPNAEVVFSPVPEAAAVLYWDGAEDVAASVSASLATAQGAATKWVGVLSTALGLLALAGVLGGRSTIQELGGMAQFILAVALVIAIAADVYMIIKGNLAGLTFPKVTNAIAKRELADTDLTPLVQAKESVDRLNRAKIGAIVSGIAAAVAIGVFLFAPATSAAPAPKVLGQFKITITIDKQTNGTACGTLTENIARTTYTFTPKGGPATVYPATDVSGITPC